MLTIMEQKLRDLESATGELAQIQNQYQQATGPAALEIKKRFDESFNRVRRLRLTALQAIQPGDTHSLIRALGVGHAYDACMILGIGSLAALISCIRNQFALLARPASLGWGANDAIPPQIDNSIVINVTAVLQSIGLRWRESHEKPRARLPEPVLSKVYNASFDPKARFKVEDFSSYAHPTLVRGVPGQFGSIINELAARGIYSWEDLALRSVADLKRTGLHGSADQAHPEGQLALVQREMRRRGLRFKKEDAPAQVEMDTIDVDKLNRGADAIDEKDPLSFEDRIKVRDKVGQVLNAIDVQNEYNDRIGAEDDQGYDQGGAIGVVDTYLEEGEETDVQDEDASVPAPANGTQAQPPA